MDFAELSEKLKVASTATLTSVLRNKGLYNTFMHQVAPLTPDMQMVGRAFTLRYIPAREDLDEVPLDNLKDVQRVGIEQVTAGDVFVIDARGDTRAGTMGSILAARLQVRGCAGIVTDGAYRDSPTIVASGLPAYAAAMNAHTNKTIHHPSEIQVPIACGGVAVFPWRHPRRRWGRGRGHTRASSRRGRCRGRGNGKKGALHHRENPRRGQYRRHLSPRRADLGRVPSLENRPTVGHPFSPDDGASDALDPRP